MPLPLDPIRAMQDAVQMQIGYCFKTIVNAANHVCRTGSLGLPYTMMSDFHRGMQAGSLGYGLLAVLPASPTTPMTCVAPPWARLAPYHATPASWPPFGSKLAAASVNAGLVVFRFSWRV